jgi:gliding motility-associated-like protein/uncharacterized repeat protein (TIGR01451 family)
MKKSGIQNDSTGQMLSIRRIMRQFDIQIAMFYTKFKDISVMFFGNIWNQGLRLRIILMLLLVMGLQSLAQPPVNERLYLKSGDQLGRTIGSTVQTTNALFKETAVVVTNGTGYFKTSNSGYDTGILSSNGNNQFSTRTTYTPSGTNRAIIVSIGSYVKVPELNNTVSSVTFGGVPLTKKFEYQFNDQKKSGYNLKLEVWYLLDPSNTAGAINVNWQIGPVLEASAGVTVLANVDQDNPFGNIATANALTGPPSILVETAPGDLVLDVISAFKQNYTGISPQTTVFSDGSNDVKVSSSYRDASSGAATTTLMQWTPSNASNPYIIAGFAVKGQTNDAVFTQTPALCAPITVKSGSPITIKASATVTTGTVTASDIPFDAQLTYGTSTLLNLGIATQAGLAGVGTSGTLTWTGTLPSDISIPAGEALTLTISSDYPSADISIKFDDPTSGLSYIELPVSNPVQLSVYDAPFSSGGNLLTSSDLGNTHYIQATVSTPFGTDDITGLDFLLSLGVNTSTVTGTLVHTDAGTCNKTFEYAWTPTIAGPYSIIARAANVQINTINSPAGSFQVVPAGCDEPANDVATTAAGQPVIINVLENDESQAYTPIIVTQPQYGSVVVNQDFKVTYKPILGYTGQDVFTYKICEDEAAPIATVTVNMLDAILIEEDTQHTFEIPPVSDAVSYQWQLPSEFFNPAIVNTTDPSIFLDWNGVPPGIYEICVTAINDCGEGDVFCNYVVVAEIILPDYDVEGVVVNASCESGGSITIGSVLENGLPNTETQYTYSWTGPGNFTAETRDISNLVQGMYILTVSENNIIIAQKAFYVKYSCLGVAKSLSSGPVNNGDGTYTLGFTIKVENLGDTYLNNIQLEEDLAETFDEALSFSIIDLISGNFTVNPAFNGNLDENLINPDLPGSLAPGATGYLSLQVKVTPGENLGTYQNTVKGTAVDPSGKLLSDDSQDGILTDPGINGQNPDGNPTNNNVPTPVLFTENPVLGVAKSLSQAPVNNGDGSFNLAYTITVQNLGDVPLKQIQLAEDLAHTFGSTAPFELVSFTISAGLTKNTAFDGSDDTYLLTGTDQLSVNQIETLQLTIKVWPISGGPFDNQVTGTAKGPGGTPVSDLSTDGTNPDPNNDKNPDEEVPTQVSFPENPQVGLAKRIKSGPANNGDGTYNLTYEFLIQNSGDVPLNNVQVVDDLDVVFGSKLVSVVLLEASNGLTTNINYDGTTNNTLLSGSDRMEVNASGIITLSIQIRPGSDLGPYENQAEASGKGLYGNTVTDLSHDGADPDPENDGPGNNSNKTSVTFTEAPQIGIAKSVNNPVNNGDGSYSISYTLIVQNTGDVPLSNIQVEENLAATFYGATGFAVIGSVVSNNAALQINSNFNGNTDKLLLNASNSALALGETATLTLQVNVFPGSNLGAYNNVAEVRADSPSGAIITDLSTNGSNVDPDGDGNPGNNGIPTPVSFTENPELTVSKSAGAVTEIADNEYSVTYSIVVNNSGDIVVNSLQIVEDLSQTFPGASEITISGLTFAVGNSASSLLLEPSFDGISVIDLLTGDKSIYPGQSAIIDLIVTFKTTLGGSYENEVLVFGTSPTGENLVKSAVAPILLYETPLIGIAKQIKSVTANADNTVFTVTLELNVQNYGNVVLTNLEIFDDIITQFAGMSATGFSTDIPSDIDITDDKYNILSGNTLWNGTAASNILAEGQELEPGQSGTAWITYSVTPGTVGSANNTATAKGQSPSGAVTEDVSQDGLDPDPADGLSPADGDPTNNNIPTPIVFPDAVNDNYTTTFNTPVEDDVSGNDVYPAGSVFAVVTDVPSTDGTLVFNADGTFTFTPANGFTGVTTFTYRVCLQAPSNTVCDQAVATIVVGPDAVNDNFTTAFNTPVTDDVSENDVYPAGSVFAVVTDVPAADGTLAFNADGSFTFTPAEGFAGVTTFTYSVCLAAPNGAVCDQAIAAILVGPDAVNDSYTTTFNTPVTDDVSGNDVYPAGSVFTVVTDVPATDGTILFNADGTFMFTPAAGFTGVTTFTYRVCLPAPNGAVCDQAVATIVVGPDAVINSYTTGYQTPVSGNVSLNDTYPAGSVFARLTSPSSGSIQFNSDGTFVYTPVTGFSGVVTFDYQVCLPAPNSSLCDLATVTIAIGPDAINDYYATSFETMVSGDASNLDKYQANSIFTKLNDPVSGSVLFNSNGTFTYTPAAGYSGVVTFDYQVCLPAPYSSLCDMATVTITIGPDAINDSYITNHATPVNGDAYLNDKFPGGSVFTKLTNPANGSVVFNSDGTFIYTPANGFTGTVTFDYQVCLPAPNNSICDQAMVTIVVGPDAINDLYITSFETPVSGNVSVNDKFPAGSAFTKLTNPANGSVAFNNDGTFIYTPADGFSGVVTFDYEVCLPSPYSNLCDQATITIVVGPVAVNDSYTTSYMTPVSDNTSKNDSFPANSLFTKLSDPSNGKVIFHTDGSFTYVPDEGFRGIDNFIYMVCLPDPYSNVCDEATVTIFVEQPGLIIEKKVAEKSYSAVGEILHYEIIVTNIGNISLTDVLVRDPLTGLSQTIPSLLPGTNHTVTLKTEYTTGQHDLNTGEVVNVASATFQYEGKTYTTTDEAIVQAVQNPRLQLTKRSQAAEYTKTGESILYVIEVTNTGNVTLRDVLVSDPLTGLQQTIAVLEPGIVNTVTVETVYTVTGADLEAGYILNTATATANFGGTPVQSADSVRIEGIAPPEAEDLESKDNQPGTAVTINILVNDNLGDGSPATPESVTIDLDPSSPGIQTTLTVAGEGTWSYNPANGDLSFTPLPGFLRSPTPISYVLTEKSTGLSSQAVVKVEYQSISVIEANDDVVGPLNSWEGASLLVNVLTNDRLNGQPANNGNVILSIVTPASHPGVYIEPATGNVIVGYGTPAGVYRIVYRICEKQLPQNCDQAVVTVTVVDDCELVIPNGFSPNGDGIADFWRIKCLDKYPDARVEIYNRWGNLVYDLDHYGNTDVHGATDAWWDGHSTHKWTLGNEKLPAGTYFYILDLRDGSKPLNGFIFLNR